MPMVTVDKFRQERRLNDVIIAMDTVQGLGAFAEFEYRGDVDDAATSALHVVINKIGLELGELDRRGYPYQFLQRER